ncbi:MAG TPA: phenylalanine--tRNA ligase beta subunit-related protein [Candidatus Acidoferrales bacterium]|nr:phenylalanine--tRNA ligase beta subunit-related protein [Candidatus Acidoferrales bacterium]
MTLARTGGLALEVDEALRGVMTFGWLEADGVHGDALPPAFAEERDAVVTRLRTRFGDRPAADIAGVAENRAMFHRLGVDPTKTRPASEALLRRVLQGRGLPEILPVVDVCNLASLEHQLPLGLYDRDRVQHAVIARLGGSGDGYDGIRKGRVNLAGRPLLADDDGPFGAPTSDSARTQVTARTTALLAVVFSPSERRTEDLSAMLARIADLLARYCSATVRVVHTLQ